MAPDHSMTNHTWFEMLGLRHISRMSIRIDGAQSGISKSDSADRVESCMCSAARAIALTRPSRKRSKNALRSGSVLTSVIAHADSSDVSVLARMLYAASRVNGCAGGGGSAQALR